MTDSSAGADQLLIDGPDDGVVVMTINRPGNLNALTVELRHRLIEALRSFADDDRARVAILTGAGRRAFSAGQDLAEAREFDGERVDDWIDEWEELFDACLSCPKPLVAAVNGYAVGASLQLAAMCDIRIASDSARVGLPEVDDAIPCITGTWALADLIGHGLIADLILTGRLIDARYAERLGLFSHVVPPAQLLPLAQSIARDLAAKPPLAIGLNKANLRRLRWSSWPDAANEAKRAHGAAFGSGEPRESMDSFLSGAAQGRSQ